MPESVPPDQKTIGLILQLTSLQGQAIKAAAEALTASEATTPDMSKGPPAEAPTLLVALHEQQRAFRFTACAAKIGEAIKELERSIQPQGS